jgi:hypothetical protein
MKKIALIFFSLIFLLGAVSFAQAASLSFSPSSGTQQVGKNFTVSFFVNTQGEVMNASSGTVSFPPSLLEVVSISKTGSIFSLWVQEPGYSNTNGTINFEGVVLNPGFTGSAGKLLTVTFRPKAEGKATVTFNQGSVLANDGLGTNIASTLSSANFVIGPSTTQVPTAPTVSSLVIASPTHPDQDAWYNLTSATFDWVIPVGALETRLLIGRNENSTPTVIYNPPISTKTVDELGEGTYYFSVQHRTSAGWSPISRFRLNIDTTAPASFEIKEDEETGVPTISFETDDLDSGFSHYELVVADGEPVRIDERVVTSYALPVEYAGVQTVLVTAYDKAGNTTESSIEVDFGTPTQTKPIITEYPEQIEQGKPLTISGTGTPGNVVEFTLLRRTSVVWTDTGVVEGDGTFSFSIPSKLALGYHMAVVSSVVDDTRINSKPVSIEVVPAPLLGFALTFVSYLGIGVLVVAGLASFIKIIIYFGYDLRRTLSFLKRNGGKNTSQKTKEVTSPLKVTKQNVNKKFF